MRNVMQMNSDNFEDPNVYSQCFELGNLGNCHLATVLRHVLIVLERFLEVIV